MSTLGVPNIVKCPGCGQLLEEMRLTSGNTLYARFWSDAKTEAPMMPRVPFIIKCPECGEIFLPSKHYHKLEADNNILSKFHAFWNDGEEDWMSRREQDYREQAHISAMNLPDTMNCRLGFHDAVRAFDMIGGKSSAYMLIWHTYNDFYREGRPEEAKQAEEIFRTFTDGLFGVLDQSENDTLLRAEFHRELGGFRECMDILDNYPFRDRYVRLAEQVKAKAINGETEVFCFDMEG